MRAFSTVQRWSLFFEFPYRVLKVRVTDSRYLDALPIHLWFIYFCFFFPGIFTSRVSLVWFISLHLLIEPSGAKQQGLLYFLSGIFGGLFFLVMEGVAENLYTYKHT